MGEGGNPMVSGVMQVHSNPCLGPLTPCIPVEGGNHTPSLLCCLWNVSLLFHIHRICMCRDSNLPAKSTLSVYWGGMWVPTQTVWIPANQTPIQQHHSSVIMTSLGPCREKVESWWGQYQKLLKKINQKMGSVHKFLTLDNFCFMCMYYYRERKFEVPPREMM